MINLKKANNRLQFLCQNIPDLLYNIPEQEFCYKPVSDKWSKKEILGHLIDSAANNHQRFIRVQFENVPDITYDQNNWNKYSHHNSIDAEHLILFWKLYNQHLLQLIKHIPQKSLDRECKIGEMNNVTLHQLVEDYVVHLEHHLHQLTKY